AGSGGECCLSSSALSARRLCSKTEHYRGTAKLQATGEGRGSSAALAAASLERRARTDRLGRYPVTSVPPGCRAVVPPWAARHAAADAKAHVRYLAATTAHDSVRRGAPWELVPARAVRCR